MNLSSNTVLITGGGSGIGFALAERFAKAGSTVIISGRRKEKLEEAKLAHANIHTYACDVSEESQRRDLVAWVTEKFPKLNVVINNAGIQRLVDLTSQEPWKDTNSELATNLAAPIHLSQLFIPHLMKQENPCLMNVTSGLSFAPLANVPVYCATKAALHSFTLSLRYQLKDTPIKVVEIIPPAVDTDLQGPGLHTFGVNLDEFADAIFKGLGEGAIEVAYGTADHGRRAAHQAFDETFRRMNPA
jgi:uncharacterized oxidoreductase